MRALLKGLGRLLVIVACFGVGACAFDVIHVDKVPARLDAAGPTGPSFHLAQDVNVMLPTGYGRQLRGGTNWKYVGKLKFGEVFKTDDQVLTVEGSNIYEAYIVTSSNKLVGFYLPVEQSYVPLGEPAQLPMINNIN